MNTLLCIGYGYTAHALARALPADSWKIIGTTRSAETAQKIRAEGHDAVIWPQTSLEPVLKQATHLLISAAPDQSGDPVLTTAKPTLSAWAHEHKWLGYLSTTSVYGNHDGRWVDETTPPTPSSPRGARRVEAERAWQQLAAQTGLPVHIFRLAGIYGPERTPFARIRTGTARRIIKAGQVFNRIHVDDISQVLQASIRTPNPGAIYNLCDDAPAPPQDVIAFAAQLLGYPIPPAVPFETADLSDAARSFYSDSKRIKNDCIKRELGVSLTYPTYKVGLKALLQNATS